MSKERILIVEDDEDIQQLVSYNCIKGGYEVICVDDGEQALSAAQSEAFDLVLLDLMLPGVDGLTVCKRLKQDEKLNRLPIIMLTAKGEESDIVTGLNLGADDYVTKPFSPKVLMARIQAVLRRQEQEAPASLEETITVGDLVIHPGRHEVFLNGTPIHLTLTEFGILHLLAGRPGWVFTRQQLIDAVRGYDYIITERAMDVQIFGLRKKLGEKGALIETVRGIGYRFKDLSNR